MLADDNFYPVAFADLEMAKRRLDKSALQELETVRKERFELMERLADLPDDMVFMTQITMEAAEDPAFLDAMRKAHIRGALVGVESVTKEGLKSIYKDFNLHGDALVERLKIFRQHGVHVLGSFIFGLPTDTADTFDATAALAQAADVTFAQFVLLQPFPGTVDFEKWEKAQVDPAAHRRHPDHAPLAAADVEAAEDLHAAPEPEARRDQGLHPAGLGQVLQPAGHLEARAVREVAQGAAGVRADLEAVPPDVREHGHRHRQRAACARQPHGEADRQTVPAALRVAGSRAARASISRRSGRP